MTSAGVGLNLIVVLMIWAQARHVLLSVEILGWLAVNGAAVLLLFLSLQGGSYHARETAA